MAKNSAKTNILEFLQNNRQWFHNGELQKMHFANRNGSSATGDTIKRRLQNLAEEGSIFVDLRNGEAWYSAEYKPKKQYVKVGENDRGEAVMAWQIVPTQPTV